MTSASLQIDFILSKKCLPIIKSSNLKTIVGISQMNLCKSLSINKSVKYLINQQKNLSDFFSSSYLNKSNLGKTIRWFFEMSNGSNQRLQRENGSIDKVLINLFTKNLELVLKKVIE